MRGTLTQQRGVSKFHETSTHETELKLRSGSRDMRIPSILHMRMVPETSLSSGKSPGRPPDSDFVVKNSQIAAPNSDPRGIGPLEGKATALGDFGKLKEEVNLLPLSPSPTLFSGSTLWEEKKGRSSLPTHTFGIGDVNGRISNMTDTLVDESLAPSLLKNVDLYWKS